MENLRDICILLNEALENKNFGGGVHSITVDDKNWKSIESDISIFDIYPYSILKTKENPDV